MTEDKNHSSDELIRSKIEQITFQSPLLSFEGVRNDILQKKLLKTQRFNKIIASICAALIFLTGLVLNSEFKEKIVKGKVSKLEKIISYKTDTLHITQNKYIYIKTPVYIYLKPKIKVEDTLILMQNLVKNYIHIINKLLPSNNQKNIVDSNHFDRKNTQSNGEFIRNPLFDLQKINQKKFELAMNNKTLKISYKMPKYFAFKLRKVKIPILDKYNVGVFYTPEYNVATTKQISNLGTYQNNEIIKPSNSYGINLGMKITNKLYLQSGVELQKMNFKNIGEDKQQVTATLGIDNQPEFLKNTAFGLAKIPIQEMQIKPTVGTKIYVEGTTGHFIETLRIPLTLKYQLFDGKFNNVSWENSNFKFFVFGGGFCAIPTRQQLMIEVYEANGNDFYTTIKSFKNVSAYSGLKFGVDFHLNIGKKIYLNTESCFQSTLNSLVNDLPYETKIRGFGQKFGINYIFNKK